MNKLPLIILIGILISCGQKTKKDSVVAKVDSVKTPSSGGADKSYLKKRPEEFKEFFFLSDVVPFTGKVATKKDVKNGSAVFNMDSKSDPTHQFLNIRLPFFAFLIQPNNQPGTFVAIMQAEILKGDTMLGYKGGNGLFGICKPEELEYFESQKAEVYSTPK